MQLKETRELFYQRILWHFHCSGIIAQNVKCWREWVNMWVIICGWHISLTLILVLMTNCSDISLKLIGIQLITLSDKGFETFQAESTMAWTGAKTRYLSEGSEQWIIWSGLRTMWCVLPLLLIRIQIKRLVPPSDISMWISSVDCFIGRYPTSRWRAKTESHALLSVYG